MFSASFPTGKMQIIQTIDEFFSWRKKLTGSIGFVPTMGALHQGHLSLVEQSNNICDSTIVSIYVNPAQFSANEDLGSYPRQLQEDLNALSSFQVDAVFIPDDKQMYPSGHSTFVLEENLSSMHEGASRPNHFRGVTTIVAKLFNIVRPTHSFFGEKDAQQLRVISSMARDLNYPIQIVPCETKREPHGLAMSSRNEYLSQEERKRAGIINQSLSDCKKLLGDGVLSAKELRQFLNDRISMESLAKIDYVSISDDQTMQEIEDKISGNILVSVAVFFGSTRLIDNFSWKFQA